ncbi:MAG: ATP-binding protein, partial [Polyangiaceae bacterium]
VIGNAVDASPPGAEVAVDVHRDGESAVIAVRDRGPGIAPEDLPRLFEPFFTRKEPGKGVGLGLTIARSVIEAHGGSIEVENDRSAGGATARVRLPLALPQAPASGAEPRSGLNGAPEGASLARGVG